MATKLLSKGQCKEMKMLFAAGYGPEQVSQHFEIAVSSVYNYRRQFEIEDGVKYQSLRGKRPLDVTPKAYIRVMTEFKPVNGKLSPEEALEKARHLEEHLGPKSTKEDRAAFFKDLMQQQNGPASSGETITREVKPASGSSAEHAEDSGKQSLQDAPIQIVMNGVAITIKSGTRSVDIDPSTNTINIKS